MQGANSRRTFLITLQVTPGYNPDTEEHDPPDAGADVLITDSRQRLCPVLVRDVKGNLADRVIKELNSEPVS